MKPVHHISLSTILSGILYAVFRSWELSITAFIFGTIIDIDHIIDYVMERGLSFHVKSFFTFFYQENHNRITLLLHGWEWFLALGIAVFVTNYNTAVTGAFIGYGHHIISDYFYSKAGIQAYSLAWRWNKRFDSKIIFPRNRGYTP